MLEKSAGAAETGAQVAGGRRQEGRAGLLYALAGFALLPVGDSVVKSMAGEWPGTAVAALRFTIGACALGLLLAIREGRSGFRIRRPGLHAARGIALAGASLCFFLAIFVMPLAEATTISFVSPLAAAALSALFLGEHPPRALWPASGLALAGVILVLRPNLAEVGWAGALPLLSAVIFAAMIVLNRAAAGTGSMIAMQFAISAGAAIMLVISAVAGHFAGIPDFVVTWPDWTVIARCAFVAVTATSAHALIFLATMRAPAAAIAPMVYVQLLMAMAIGAVFFGDLPDLAGLAGALLVIAGGLYLWRQSGKA